MAEIALEAGLPEGILNVVTGIGRVTGAALAGHPGIDLLDFTGSTATGRTVMQLAAANNTPVHLELGGKSPQIFFADMVDTHGVEGFCGSGAQLHYSARAWFQLPMARHHLPKAAATAQAVGFCHIDDPYGRADLQFHFSPFSFDVDSKGKVFLPREPLLLIAPSLNHPVGSGRITPRARDPEAPPIIEPRFLEDARDVDTLAKGIRMVVDTSVFPSHISGNTHAAALMIGEKAAKEFMQ